MGRVRPAWRGMAHTRKKDEDETTASSAAGASSARYSLRPPANNGWIKISLSVSAILASPDQRQHAERGLAPPRIRQDRIDRSWSAIHRVNAPERKRQMACGCDRTSACPSGGE